MKPRFVNALLLWLLLITPVLFAKSPPARNSREGLRGANLLIHRPL